MCRLEATFRVDGGGREVVCLQEPILAREQEAALPRFRAGKILEKLGFIPNKQRWEFPFRRGLFEVPQPDFERIAQAMRT